MPWGFEKKVPNLQVGGPTPAPHTPPVIRVVLLHTEPAVQDYVHLLYVNLGLSFLSSLNFNQRPAQKVARGWALSNAWMGDRSAYCDSSKVINFLKTNTT